MEPARIAELLQPFLDPTAGPPADGGLQPESKAHTQSQLRDISTYIDILRRWNARMNLTAVRPPEEVVTRHFGESLFAARHLFDRVSAEPAGESPLDLIDLGSGAGFPGLPIKIWAPRLRVALIESNHKKAAFLREVIRVLILTDIDVFCGRAEGFSGHARCVALRAVERFDTVLPEAARLVAPGGRLALLISQAQVERTRELAPTFHWTTPLPIPLSTNRVLLVGKKAEPG